MRMGEKHHMLVLCKLVDRREHGKREKKEKEEREKKDKKEDDESLREKVKRKRKIEEVNIRFSCGHSNRVELG